jgi:hypothetical protein
MSLCFIPRRHEATKQWSAQSRGAAPHGPERYAEGHHQRIAARQVHAGRLGQPLPHSAAGGFLKCDCPASFVASCLRGGKSAGKSGHRPSQVIRITVIRHARPLSPDPNTWSTAAGSSSMRGSAQSCCASSRPVDFAHSGHQRQSRYGPSKSACSTELLAGWKIMALAESRR